MGSYLAHTLPFGQALRYDWNVKKKWKGRLERRNSGKNLKGRVTSGTEFRKILSPLPSHLLPSLDTITQHRKTQKSIQSSQHHGSDEMSIENQSLLDADGLPAWSSRHWNRQFWGIGAGDTSSRTFPISWRLTHLITTDFLVQLPME